jgi:uncharacterized protein YigE (DUF2233 family)
MSAPRKHSLLFALAFCLLAALPCPAGEKTEASKPPAAPWTVTKDSGWKELEKGLELREETLHWKQSQGGKESVLNLRLTAVRLDSKRFALRIVKNPVKDRKKLLDVARAEKVPVLVNGAYFGPADEPVTLLVSGGKALSKPNAKLPRSGIFTLDEQGRAAVRRLDEVKPPYKGLDFAVQNSPWLVAGGRAIYTETKVEHRDGEFPARRYRRTGLGISPDGGVVFLVCDDGIWLAGFAEVLAAPEATGGFGLDAAINLDGGPSTGMVVAHEKARIDIPAGPTIIPHVITVSKREQPLAAEPARAGSAK